MKLISSRDNALYKEFKQLATSASARKKAGKALLDGVHLCEAFLQTGAQVEWCVVSESAQSHPEVANLLHACAGKQGICLPDKLFAALSQVEHGVDVLFIIAQPCLAIPDALCNNAVLLDRVQDPGNLGSILRSAAAAGITEIYLSPGSVSAWSPKVLRAGMGAHFLLKIHENVDLVSLIKTSRIPIVATSSHTPQTIYAAPLAQNLAWLFGHEGQGVAEELAGLAQLCVTIPQQSALESMNVAASAAVCFFEQLRQTRYR